MALAETTRQAHMNQNEGRKVRVITDLVTIKATTADTGGAFALVETSTPPGGGFPQHSQSYDDATFVVLEGTYRLQVGEQALDLEPGGCVFVPRGTPHGFANTGDVAARMLVIASPGGVWERFIDEIGDAIDRAPWAIDMARVLAVAPKYGIAFASTRPGGDAGGAPG